MTFASPACRRGLLAAGLLALLLAPAAARSRGQSGAAPSADRWFKGNTHTHTLNSDGDSTPDDVVRWYREHGYQFLVLTDHNYLTSVDGLNALHGAVDRFLVIPGEEVTMTADKKPVHVNGLGVETVVAAPAAGSVVEALQQAVDGIRAARGVPAVNHPNYGWAVTPDDLRRLTRTNLLEIFNGHPQVNNAGGGGVPGLEEIWDRVLTGDRLMFGLRITNRFPRLSQAAMTPNSASLVTTRSVASRPNSSTTSRA